MRRIVVTLSAIAFALVAVTGSAKAPVFSSLPDVVISDYEKNEAGSFTQDFNFFEYMNAFDVLTYATDEDSTPNTDLKFAFTEDPPDVSDLEINDVQQLDQGLYDPTDPTTWPAGSLIIPSGQGAGGDFTVSFRDIVRSPGTGEGPFPDPLFEEGGAAVTSDQAGIYLPWHDASGQLVRSPSDMPERPVTIWAGDQDDNTGSGTLLVYSVNSDETGPMDSLANVIATIFTNDFGDWTTETAGGLPAATTTQNGALTLQAGAGQLTFTRWKIMNNEEKGGYPQAPAGANIFWVPIEYVDDDSLIYSARFTIQHDQAARNTVPTMRIGIIDALQYQAIMNRVGTIPGATEGQNSQWGDQDTDKVYNVVWANNVGEGKDSLDLGANGGDMRNYKAFFDILNRNSASGQGTLTLGTFDVVTLPKPADTAATAVTMTDFTNEETPVGGASSSTAGGVLSLTTPASTATTVPFVLTLNTDVIQMQADSLVRLNVALSCPSDADRTNFHNLRVRHDTPYQNQDGLYYVTQLNSGLAGTVGLPGLPVSQATSPGATSEYEVYVPVYVDDLSEITPVGAPAGRTTSDHFGLGLDYIGAAPGSGPAANQASTVTVHSVSYEVLNMPSGL